jgi:hypothetical protein
MVHKEMQKKKNYGKLNYCGYYQFINQHFHTVFFFAFDADTTKTFIFD